VKNASAHTVPTLSEAATWPAEKVVETMHSLTREVAQLQHQLDWFKRQIFGQKSEKRLLPENPAQMSLGELPIPDTPTPVKHIPAHTRQSRPTNVAQSSDESALFFDDKQVPVETITLQPAEAEGLDPDEYEVISEKVSHRLAQRPGSYVILKYIRPVIKLRETTRLVVAPAPASVIDGSRADVSFVAGLLVDKFAWHLPLHRQHQRLLAAGIKMSRPWLTQLVGEASALLKPIYTAQLASVVASRVKAMDETPIKAGQAGPGKMKTGYFWPIYGELDEVCFPFFADRSHKNVEALLGLQPGKDSVLLSDGYGAYESYARKTGITHAQCWTHCRREFINAQAAEPVLAAEALDQIGALYAVEAQIQGQKLRGGAKHAHRLQHAKPIVERFFDWVDAALDKQAFVPSNPLTKALGYARSRRRSLEVFLTDPQVPVDTNHLERALRPIPLGRKNWLFCWTEVGAENAGIVQSLIATCRLHQIDPCRYLVDVLQRVGQHPDKQVAELTPRAWKERFADRPLRSDVEKSRERGLASTPGG
jgi:transposase